MYAVAAKRIVAVVYTQEPRPVRMLWRSRGTFIRAGVGGTAPFRVAVGDYIRGEPWTDA